MDHYCRFDFLSCIHVLFQMNDIRVMESSQCTAMFSDLASEHSPSLEVMVEKIQSPKSQQHIQGNKKI